MRGSCTCGGEEGAGRTGAAVVKEWHTNEGKLCAAHVVASGVRREGCVCACAAGASAFDDAGGVTARRTHLAVQHAAPTWLCSTRPVTESSRSTVRAGGPSAALRTAFTSSCQTSQVRAFHTRQTGHRWTRSDAAAQHSVPEQRGREGTLGKSGLTAPELSTLGMRTRKEWHGCIRTGPRGEAEQKGRATTGSPPPGPQKSRVVAVVAGGGKRLERGKGQERGGIAKRAASLPRLT
eukprot:365157-Chlamydomonas_euryale.AAC.18